MTSDNIEKACNEIMSLYRDPGWNTRIKKKEVKEQNVMAICEKYKVKMSLIKNILNL